MAQIIPGGVVGPTQGQYQQAADQAFSQNAANMFVNARNYRAQQRQQRVQNAQTLLQRHLDAGRTLGEFYEDNPGVVSTILKDGLGYRGEALDSAVERFRTGEMSNQEWLELAARERHTGETEPPPQQRAQGQDPWLPADQQPVSWQERAAQEGQPPQQGPAVSYTPVGAVNPVQAAPPPPNQGPIVDAVTGAAPQFPPGQEPLTSVGGRAQPAEGYTTTGAMTQTDTRQPPMTTGQLTGGEPVNRWSGGATTTPGTPQTTQAAPQAPPVATSPQPAPEQPGTLSYPEIAATALERIAEGGDGAYAEFNNVMPPALQRSPSGEIVAGQFREGADLDKVNAIIEEFGYVDEQGNPDYETYEAMRQLAIHRAQQGQSDYTALPTPTELEMPFMKTVREEIENSPEYVQRAAEDLDDANQQINSNNFSENMMSLLDAEGVSPALATSLTASMREEANALTAAANEAALTRSAGGEVTTAQRREINRSAEELIDTIDRTRTVAGFREMRSTPEGNARINSLLEDRMNDPAYLRAVGIAYDQPTTVAAANVMSQIEASQTPEALQANMIDTLLKIRELDIDEYEALTDRQRAEIAAIEADTGRILAETGIARLEQEGMLDTVRVLTNENVWKGLDDTTQRRVEEHVLVAMGFDPEDLTIKQREWFVFNLRDQLITEDRAARGGSIPTTPRPGGNTETATSALSPEEQALLDSFLSGQ